MATARRQLPTWAASHSPAGVADQDGPFIPQYELMEEDTSMEDLKKDFELLLEPKRKMPSAVAPSQPERSKLSAEGHTQLPVPPDRHPSNPAFPSSHPATAAAAAAAAASPCSPSSSAAAAAAAASAAASQCRSSCSSSSSLLGPSAAEESALPNNNPSTVSKSSSSSISTSNSAAPSSTSTSASTSTSTSSSSSPSYHISSNSPPSNSRPSATPTAATTTTSSLSHLTSTATPPKPRLSATPTAVCHRTSAPASSPPTASTQASSSSSSSLSCAPAPSHSNASTHPASFQSHPTTSAPTGPEEDPPTSRRRTESTQLGGPLPRARWSDLPQDLAVSICASLLPPEVLSLRLVNRRTNEVAHREELWRHFCAWRWGDGANTKLYRKAKSLFWDCNGWFPTHGPNRDSPDFSLKQVRLRANNTVTMDLRFSNEDIIAVSEADYDDNPKEAVISIVDPETCAIRQTIPVSDSTINCCDEYDSLVYLAGSDGSVSLLRRTADTAEVSHQESRSPGDYAISSAFRLTDEINDLRITREGSLVVIRTQENRHPAGMDVIPIERPDARLALQGGTPACNGKYIHALDGFQDGCTLNSMACSGEHPGKNNFSALLFDFRRPLPCVVDLPVTSLQLGDPVGTMLWPLRAGVSSKVYAHVLPVENNNRPDKFGTIAMIDFRYAAPGRFVTFQLPGPIEDLRCFDGHLISVHSESSDSPRLDVTRSDGTAGGPLEHLASIVEVYDKAVRPPSLSPDQEDLKVLGMSARGFAVSYRQQLAVGSLQCPSWRLLE